MVELQTSYEDSIPCSSDHQQSNQPCIIVLYKRRWVVLAIFSLISMSNEIIWISFGSIASIIKEYYRVSFNAVNWLAMIFSVFYFLVPLSSYILNRYGLKITIISAAVLNAIGSYFRIAGRHRNGFTYVLIGNGFASLAQCFILFVPSTLAATWFSETERAKATSIGIQANICGVAVGFLMGGILVPSTKDYDGKVKERIHLTLLSQAILCSILVIVSVMFLKDAPLNPPSMSQYLKKKKKENQLDPNTILQNNNARFIDHVITLTQATNECSNIATFEDSMLSIQNKERHKQGSVKSTILDLNVEHSATQKIFNALRQLFTNLSFQLMVQAFALYSSPFLAYSVNLNQMCTLMFPGREQDIGLMGFAAVIFGSISLPLAGVLIDKTHRYQLISLVILACSTVSMLVFTLVLKYSGSFLFVFVTFCISGFFSYPYFPVVLEYAADITYPISEGLSSSIMYVMGNAYGLAAIYIIEVILNTGRADIAGYVMAGIYAASLICGFFIRGRLKRLEADNKSITDIYNENDSNVVTTNVLSNNVSTANPPDINIPAPMKCEESNIVSVV